jgi:hypothetical protein
MTFEGRVALVENLECFLRMEAIIPDVPLVINSAGRISDRLIACLARSHFEAPPLLHLPDYDPVGLGDYLRLREALAGRVSLFVPSDISCRQIWKSALRYLAIGSSSPKSPAIARYSSNSSGALGRVSSRGEFSNSSRKLGVVWNRSVCC